MKKQSHRHDDDLFIDDDDPIWNEPGTKPKIGKPRRERMRGDFYLCSKTWADKAAEVAGQYLILALRLYRCWQMRKPGTDSIAVAAEALAGPGPGGGRERTGRRRLITRLEAAGLIEVVERAPRRAIRIRIIDLLVP
jgi:hypothetical protein